MACGGCRGRALANKRRMASHPDCAELEENGAALTLYPMNTNAGLKLVVRTKRHGVIELSSFVAASSCSGSTLTLLKRYVSELTALATSTPAKFAPYVGKGINLSGAISLL